ncbi:MAG: M48 family metallopeptidase [Candidatus Binatia bacterium]
MVIKNGFPSILLLLFAITAGCGTQLQRPSVDSALVEAERVRQMELAVKERWEREQKLLRISDRISAAGAELCGEEIAFRAGFVLADRNSLPEENREIAVRILKLVRDDPQVTYVTPGLPADTAGLKVGDIILKVGDKKVSEIIPDAKSKVKPIYEIIKTNGKTPYQLEILRFEETKPLTIKPVAVCKYPVALSNDDKVNAFADGEKIGITTGMLRFAKDDDELAFIVSHEIAHNALGHLSRMRGNQLAGGALGILLDIGVAALGVNTGGAFTRAGMNAGSLVFSQDFELEADYLGIYFAGRAGYDVTKAPDFFRRMSNEHPGTIKGNFFSTHPSNPERTLAVESTIKELRHRIHAEEPLLPSRMPKVASESKPEESKPSERE